MAKRKAKQAHFEGMEPPSIKELDTAAEDYRETRNERMAMTKQETEKHSRLLELMKKHDLPIYEYDGYKVFRTNLEKVKVQKKTEDSDDVEELDEDDE